MTDWYLINPQPTLNSGFERDEFAGYARDGFDELLTETQLGKEVILCNGRFDGKHFETEFATNAIVQSETPDTYTQGWKRQLLTRVADSISNYKYIKYDNQIWLIMNEPSDNCIYDKCVIHLCNYVLRWQNRNSETVNCPASIENASQYNTGENTNKTLVLGYNQFMIYVSLDDETLRINRDLRFFIDYDKENPLPYKVTRPDKVSFSYGKSRVMCMVVTEDQYNPDTDNIELMLCDYQPPQQEITTNIIYNGEPKIRIGRSKTFKSDSPTTFSLVVSDIAKDMVHLTQTDDYSCKVSVDNKPILVGASFKLITGNQEIFIEIQGGV